jgi:hypothetical protein
MNYLKEMNKIELLKLWRKFRPPVIWLYMFFVFIIVLHIGGRFNAANVLL